jgi:hypothetical protein
VPKKFAACEMLQRTMSLTVSRDDLNAAQDLMSRSTTREFHSLITTKRQMAVSLPKAAVD